MNPTKNASLVLFTLALSDKPLTISDMQFRSGVSYNTVKRTVLADERVVKHGGYPATFSLELPTELDRTRFTVAYNRPDEGWVSWLEEIRPLLMSITAVSKDMSLDELDRKANMFASLGRSFVSLSEDLLHAINHDDDVPWFDWFRSEEDGATD